MATPETSLSESQLIDPPTPSSLQYVQLILIFSGDDKLSVVAFFISLDQIQATVNWNFHSLLAVLQSQLKGEVAVYWQENATLFDSTNYNFIKQVLTK